MVNGTNFNVAMPGNRFSILYNPAGVSDDRAPNGPQSTLGYVPYVPDGAQLAYNLEITNVERTDPAEQVDPVGYINYFKVLGFIMAGRHLTGVRAISNALNDKYPKGAWTARDEFAPLMNEVIDAVVTDPVVREKIKARVADFIKNDPVDPESKDDPPAKYSEYNADGQWGMVYSSYANVYLEYNKSLPQTSVLYDRFRALDSKLTASISLPETFGAFNVEEDYKVDLQLIESLVKKAGETSNPKEKEIIYEMLSITYVIYARHLMGMRAMSNALNKKYSKWAEKGELAPLMNDVIAEITDPVVRGKIEARVKKYVKNDPVDPESKDDPPAKYSEYNADGQWGMVYSSYAMVFVRIDEAIRGLFDPYKKVGELHDELCDDIKLWKPGEIPAPDKFDEASFLTDLIPKLTPENVNACAESKAKGLTERDMPWAQLKPVWANYIKRVYSVLGVDLAAVSGRNGGAGMQILDDLLERGHEGKPTGITAEDIEELTRRIETIENNKIDLTETAYDMAARAIHEDPESVPPSLKSEDVAQTAVIRKIGAAGIVPKGIRVPKGTKVP